jgi:tetratricopeptide (TPR) repeat protein
MAVQNSNLIIKKILLLLILFIFFLFLILNIAFSQNVSSLLVGVVNNQKPAVVDYLKKIKPLLQFQDELKNYQQRYGVSLKDEVFKDETLRREEIARLEQLLIKNNQARDVLYKLYLLYKEDGDSNKARQYLDRAKEVDPTIK